MSSVTCWLAACILILSLSGPIAASGDVRLIQAVKSGSVQAVQVLIRQKADVNGRYPDGATALHWAVNAEDLAMTAMLLGAGAKVDVANDYGVTPLTIAAGGRSGEIVAALLAAGANPNSTLPTGETALMTASRSGSLAAVNALLARGADPNARERAMGQTALMWAISENHAEVAAVLIAKGANIRATTEGGFTPFLFAVREGRADFARQLLDRGVDVNETDKAGNSALHIAVVRGHLDVAKYLLSRGADPNADKCGYTPLHWVAGTWETIHSHDYIFNETAVIRVQEWAVLAGITNPIAKHDMIIALLAHGADINKRLVKKFPKFGFSLFKDILTHGGTPFYLASLVSDLPTMRLLLANGADPTLPADDGSTPLIIAAGLARVPNETRVPEQRVIDALTFLLTLRNDINAANKAGNTALHAATMWGLDNVVRFLVENGANINAKNKKGDTALKLAYGFEDTALYFERPSIAKLLTELGAEEPPQPVRAPTGVEVQKQTPVAAPKE